jgi:protein-L-isoaspartate(D-aspartate) O-methyltransferase
MTDTTVDDTWATSLRQDLVAQLVRDGQIVSAEVRRAFEAVPRHLFAPEASLEDAYANDIVRTKVDAPGMTTSSVSAPWLQAAMLEQAQIGPGMRCLEVGSGGFNAALMAELVGPDGHVTTVDIDPDVTERARRCLDIAGYQRVRVVLADAETGVPEHGPYDRIVVTVGMWDVPTGLTAQLAQSGRMVVPLRLRGLRRSVCLVRGRTGLASTGHIMAGFVDVQGTGARPERLVLLHAEDVALRLDDDLPVDADGLRGSIAEPRVSAWSGVRFGGMEPFDELFLWLATAFDEFALITRRRSDAAKALVDPASPIGTPAVLDGPSLAYVTYRQVDPATDTHEFGAHGHGPDGVTLAEAVCEQVRVWDRDHRGGLGAQISVLPAGTPVDRLPPGRIVPKRHTTIVISWPNRRADERQ